MLISLKTHRFTENPFNTGKYTIKLQDQYKFQPSEPPNFLRYSHFFLYAKIAKTLHLCELLAISKINFLLNILTCKLTFPCINKTLFSKN